eukprot:COSAG05_NODE_29_length_29038_cov_1237.466985_11_plen_50_part_00
MTEARARELLNKYDADFDGKLCLAEMRNLVRACAVRGALLIVHAEKLAS